MVPPPQILDGARVLRHAIVSSAVEPTGQTVHRIANEVMGPASGLAVCQYDGDEEFYLFYCDNNWNVIADTWHLTMESALQQAVFEYRGVSFS